ncbi:MAG: YnfA family protein [Archaeoglobaceae archaeon]
MISVSQKYGCQKILKSAVLFVLAGLFEIGGGYGVWLREEKAFIYAVIGAVLLILYGVVPTYQPAYFGRVYAAYGGVFVVMSLLWGWKTDGISPDFSLIFKPKT